MSKSRKFSPLYLTRHKNVCEKSIRKVCSAKTGLYTIDFYDLVKGSVAAPPSGGSGLKPEVLFFKGEEYFSAVAAPPSGGSGLKPSKRPVIRPAIKLQLLPQGGVD